MKISPQTRERILQFLEENRLVCAHDLSRLWGLSRTDIRYHLNELLSEGMIEAAPLDEHAPRMRGRPKQYYRLTLQAAPDNYKGLSSALLKLLLEETPPEEYQTLFTQIAAHLRGNWFNASLQVQRYNQAVLFLNEHGYRARWEARKQGPSIYLRNCPYAALIDQFPEICQLDHTLIESLVQTPLRQQAQMSSASSPDRFTACIFSSSP